MVELTLERSQLDKSIGFTGSAARRAFVNRLNRSSPVRPTHLAASLATRREQRAAQRAAAMSSLARMLPAELPGFCGAAGIDFGRDYADSPRASACDDAQPSSASE